MRAPPRQSPGPAAPPRCGRRGHRCRRTAGCAHPGRARREIDQMHGNRRRQLQPGLAFPSRARWNMAAGSSVWRTAARGPDRPDHRCGSSHSIPPAPGSQTGAWTACRADRCSRGWEDELDHAKGIVVAWLLAQPERKAGGAIAAKVDAVPRQHPPRAIHHVQMRQRMTVRLQAGQIVANGDGPRHVPAGIDHDIGHHLGKFGRAHLGRVLAHDAAGAEHLGPVFHDGRAEFRMFTQTWRLSRSSDAIHRIRSIATRIARCRASCPVPPSPFSAAMVRGPATPSSGRPAAR